MKIRIKNVTGSLQNDWLIWEITKQTGLIEGNIVTGSYSPQNKSVHFSVGIAECTAWVGETCEEVKNDKE